LCFALFGSCARGIENIYSDVNFFVEFSKPSYDFLAGLNLFLEQKIYRNIEIVRKKPHVSRRLFKNINDDLIYV